MEPQTTVFTDRGEEMKSTFNEESIKEFEWQWVMMCLLLNGSKKNPNKEYDKKLLEGEKK